VDRLRASSIAAARSRPLSGRRKCRLLLDDQTAENRTAT
jgi:hypothetical protein